MCCFSRPVVSVTDTNIFARIASDGWQYLVYQMNFETAEDNAIILPLPVKLPADEEETLEFISLEEYGNFFKHLNRGFPLAVSREPSNSARDDAKVGSARPLLAVHEVGDFIASFVPQVEDFDRLDEQFQIPKETWDELPAYSDYGFAVFQLKSRKGKPHPMAFRFRSRLAESDGGSVFFPTVHIHDGEVHDKEGFDHTLFLQAPEFDEACGDYQQRRVSVIDPETGYVRSKWNVGEFCDIEKSQGILAEDQLVHRLEMRGRLDNTDVIAKLDLTPTSTRRRLTPLHGTAALACIGGMAGLGWLIERRNRLAEEK